MAVHAAHRSLRQSIASTPTKSSAQLITPKSRWNSVPKTMPTAATEVTFGTRIDIRKNVRQRSPRLSMFARTSASMSCGIVARRNMPTVLKTAFQK